MENKLLSYNDKNKYVFDEKSKKILRLVLNDKKFVKLLFSKLESHMMEELSFANDMLNVRKKSKSVEVPISEVLENMMTIDFTLIHDFNESLIIMSQILELITMNQIKIKNDIKDLILAFNSKSHKDNEESKLVGNKKITKLVKDLVIEEEQLQLAINQVKKLNDISNWWERRFEELKNGKDPYERI